mmetsp:Transcript_2908/g.6504  ORF Transcript_2908/g.6504 Transcript_2908/m.6504 type:complete len:235 (+) Transcript_2908:213-917(+)
MRIAVQAMALFPLLSICASDARKRFMIQSIHHLNSNLEVRESLIEENGLGHNSRECKHRKSAVGDFLKLKSLNLLLRLANKVRRSKSEVTRRASGSLKHLRHTNPRGHLRKSEENEDVSKSSELDGGIMDGGRGGTRHGLRVPWDAQTEVDGDVSQPGELAHASVLELGLAEVVHREIVRDAERIESDVSNISLAVDGVREEREGSGLLTGGEAGGGTANRSRGKGGSGANKGS